MIIFASCLWSFSHFSANKTLFPFKNDCDSNLKQFLEENIRKVFINVVACFTAVMCQSYARSLLSAFLSSLLYWGIISLESLYWNVHSYKKSNGDRATPIKYKTNLSQGPKAQLVLFMISAQKSIILSSYFYIKKNNHWTDPAWYFGGFFYLSFD